MAFVQSCECFLGGVTSKFRFLIPVNFKIQLVRTGKLLGIQRHTFFEMYVFWMKVRCLLTRSKYGYKETHWSHSFSPPFRVFGNVQCQLQAGLAHVQTFFRGHVVVPFFMYRVVNLLPPELSRKSTRNLPLDVVTRLNFPWELAKKLVNENLPICTDYEAFFTWQGVSTYYFNFFSYSRLPFRNICGHKKLASTVDLWPKPTATVRETENVTLKLGFYVNVYF